MVINTTFYPALMWNARHITQAIPPLLVGLASGTAAYILLVAFGLRSYLGPTIGQATVTMPIPVLPAGLGDLAGTAAFFQLWPTVLGGGLALAIIASFDALLCTKLVSRPGEPRRDADRLLVLGCGRVLKSESKRSRSGNQCVQPRSRG